MMMHMTPAGGIPTDRAFRAAAAGAGFAVATGSFCASFPAPC